MSVTALPNAKDAKKSVPDLEGMGLNRDVIAIEIYKSLIGGKDLTASQYRRRLLEAYMIVDTIPRVSVMSPDELTKELGTCGF